MSKPENILSRFRTYSYHHVLVVCENTDVGEELSKSLNMYKYLKTSGTERFSKNKSKSGDYIVIANNLVDSDFVIDDVSWMTVMFPQPGKENFEQFASFTVEGSFNVLEPKGIDFLNILSQAATCFGTDTSNLIFLLKTFFVGDADTNRAEYITNVKGLMFAMTDITADFSVTGATYSVQFAGITNGIAKLPQNVSGPQVNVNMKDSGQTVGEAIEKLQERIQKRYSDHYEKLTEINGGVSPGQEVKYILKIDSESGYADYLLDQMPTSRSDEGKDNGGDGIITFGKNSSIEAMMLDVLRFSKKFGDDSRGLNEKGLTYTPKILSTIQSGNNENGKFYHITYTITKLNIPVSTLENINKIDQNFVQQGNGVEFDYFFSGKNTDILEFDLQMQMGLSFFQTLTTAQTKPDNAAQNINDTQTTGATQGTAAESKDLPDFPDCNPSTERSTPILFSTDFTEAKQKNNRFPLASIDFQAMLQRQAAIEMLEAKIKIMGNPVLLNNTTLTPTEAINGRPDPTPTPDFDGGTGTLDIMRDWTTTPGLVRVNIFSPDSDITGDYQKRFWYDGWYYIIGVEHNFSQGQFTQTIEMQSLPLDVYLPQNDPGVVTVNGLTKTGAGR